MRKILSALHTVGALFLALSLFACSSKPLVPYTDQTTPTLMVPLNIAGVYDGRGRFREILCTVLAEHGKQLPDYRTCEQALTRVGDEPPGNGQPVYLGPSLDNYLVGFVPGLGWDCFAKWLGVSGTGIETVSDHVAKFGYTSTPIKVDGLSGTLVNAEHIRSAISELGSEHDGKPVILIGYSKGTPDILEFLVNYPAEAARVKAVISVSGAVGGSPLAIGAKQSQAELLVHVPGAECEKGDGGVVTGLLPEVRQRWLAENPLPGHIRYYSVVSYPHPDRISSGLKQSYKKLSEVDGRNDSQIIFYDQIIPGSTLVAFTNADHWAMAVPVNRSHSIISKTVVNQNDFPREVFTEALLRFVEEDLASTK